MLVDADGVEGAAAPNGPRTAAPGRLVRQVGRRLSWGVADQAVSSLTNFAVSIYVVRTLGAVQFGAFSLAYVTYSFVLNASRGVATEPLMVRFSGTDLPTWRRAVANCSGTAAVMGLAAGACVLAAAALLDGTAKSAFLALGLTLPGLMLQDSWRFAFFAIGRGSQAFLNDMVWAAALLPALVLLRVTGHANVFWFVFAWGAAAAVAAAVGPLQARVIPRLSGAWGWLSQHRDLGPRYLAENTSYSGAFQLRTYGVGLIAGPSRCRLRAGRQYADGPLPGHLHGDVPGHRAGGRPSSAPLATAPAAVLPPGWRCTRCGGARVGSPAAGGATEGARGPAAGPDMAADLPAGAAAHPFRHGRVRLGSAPPRACTLWGPRGGACGWRSSRRSSISAVVWWELLPEEQSGRCAAPL